MVWVPVQTMVASGLVAVSIVACRGFDCCVPARADREVHIADGGFLWITCGGDKMILI